MVCHECGHDTAVTNSRPQKRTNQVWRRRQCVFCDTIVTTLEAIDYTKSIVVRKRTSPITTLSGQATKRHPGRPAANTHDQLTAFNRDKLLLSLYQSLGHRPTALDDAGQLCQALSAKIATEAQGAAIDTTKIITLVTITLSRFDKLAAQHYQALHRQ